MATGARSVRGTGTAAVRQWRRERSELLIAACLWEIGPVNS
jgi:hypothetical protein